MPLEHLQQDSECAKKIKTEPPDMMEDEFIMKSASDIKQEESATDSSSGHNETFSPVHVKRELEEAECHQTCGKVKLVIRNDGLGFTSAFTHDSDVKKEELSTSYSSEVSDAEKSTLELNQIYHGAVKDEITSDESGTVPLKKYEKRTFSHSDMSFTESENVAEVDSGAAIKPPADDLCVSSRSLSASDPSAAISDNDIHRTSLHSPPATTFSNHAGDSIDDIVSSDVGNRGNSVSETTDVSSLPGGGLESIQTSKHFVDPDSAMDDMESADSLLQEQHAIESIMSAPDEERHNFDASACGQNVYNSALYEPISPVSSYHDESMDFGMHVSQFLQNYSVTPNSGLNLENETNLSEFQSKTVQSSSTSNSVTQSHSVSSDHSINHKLTSSATNLTNFGYMPEYTSSFCQDGPGDLQTTPSSSGMFSNSNKLLLPMQEGEKSPQVISDDDDEEEESSSDRMEFSSEPDPQQEVLNAQMQSAINSILSLNRESGFTPTATYQIEQAEQTDMYSTDQSESQCEAEDERCEDSAIDQESQDSQIDDDLDAAVNSILM